MSKGGKIALIIFGVVVLGGVVTYLLLKNKDEETGEFDFDEIDEGALTPPSGGSTGGGSTGGGSTDSCPWPSTPFKNRTEGDKFREWVNAAYGQVAKIIDGGTGKNDGLDKSGDFNNCYIRQAYSYKTAGGRTLGNIWTAITTDPTDTGTTPTGFDAKTIANNLYESMYGAGTNTSLLWASLDKITSTAKWNEVNAVFGKRKGFNGLWFTEYTLREWLDGDLTSDDERKKFNDLSTKNGWPVKLSR